MENLLIKYFSNTLTPQEQAKLRTWLQDPENKKVFEAHVRQHHDLHLSLQELDTDIAFEKIWQNIPDAKAGQRVAFPLNPDSYRERGQGVVLRPAYRHVKYAIAASVAILVAIALGFFLPVSVVDQHQSLITNHQSPGITLTLPNGTIVDLSEQKEGIIIKEDMITYNDGTSVESQATNHKPQHSNTSTPQHTLTVPYGQHFKVELADGTRIQLNAGTTLSYPASFTKDNRVITLIGEAWFDVTTNPARPFIVNAANLRVAVLGTQFNISAYPEDPTIATTLISGKVRVERSETQNNPQILKPGQQSIYNRNMEIIEVREVNTTLYTGWLTGELVFRDMAFDNILKKLERHYNIVITNNNKVLGNAVFNASFNANETIENVLSYFDESYKIKYKVKDNGIVIE